MSALLIKALSGFTVNFLQQFQGLRTRNSIGEAKLKTNSMENSNANLTTIKKIFEAINKSFVPDTVLTKCMYICSVTVTELNEYIYEGN